MGTSGKIKGKTNAMLGFLNNRTLVITVIDPYKYGPSVTRSCYVAWIDLCYLCSYYSIV